MYERLFSERKYTGEKPQFYRAREYMRTRGARLPDYKVHLNMRMQTRTNQLGQLGQGGNHLPPFCPPTRSSKSGPVKMRPAFRLPMVTQHQVSPQLKSPGTL